MCVWYLAVNPVKEQEFNIDQKPAIASESELTGKSHQPDVVKDRNMAANSTKRDIVSWVGWTVEKEDKLVL